VADAIMVNMARWLKDFGALHGTEFDSPNWNRRIAENAPRQTDGYSCGIFALM